MPNATEYLNNLAYCLADLHPERCEQALGLSLRTIELSKQNPRSGLPILFSFVLSRLDRYSEAITAIENAIELDPNRHEYHTRAAAAYRQLDKESQANESLAYCPRAARSAITGIATFKARTTARREFHYRPS